MYPTTSSNLYNQGHPRFIGSVVGSNGGHSGSPGGSGFGHPNMNTNTVYANHHNIQHLFNNLNGSDDILVGQRQANVEIPPILYMPHEILVLIFSYISKQKTILRLSRILDLSSSDPKAAAPRMVKVFVLLPSMTQGSSQLKLCLQDASSFSPEEDTFLQSIPARRGIVMMRHNNQNVVGSAASSFAYFKSNRTRRAAAPAQSTSSGSGSGASNVSNPRGDTDRNLYYVDFNNRRANNNNFPGSLLDFDEDIEDDEHSAMTLSHLTNSARELRQTVSVELGGDDESGEDWDPAEAAMLAMIAEDEIGIGRVDTDSSLVEGSASSSTSAGGGGSGEGFGMQSSSNSTSQSPMRQQSTRDFFESSLVAGGSSSSTRISSVVEPTTETIVAEEGHRDQDGDDIMMQHREDNRGDNLGSEPPRVNGGRQYRGRRVTFEDYEDFYYDTLEPSSSPRRIPLASFDNNNNDNSQASSSSSSSHPVLTSERSSNSAGSVSLEDFMAEMQRVARARGQIGGSGVNVTPRAGGSGSSTVSVQQQQQQQQKQQQQQQQQSPRRFMPLDSSFHRRRLEALRFVRISDRTGIASAGSALFGSRATPAVAAATSSSSSVMAAVPAPDVPFSDVLGLDVEVWDESGDNANVAETHQFTGDDGGDVGDRATYRVFRGAGGARNFALAANGPGQGVGVGGGVQGAFQQMLLNQQQGLHYFDNHHHHHHHLFQAHGGANINLGGGGGAAAAATAAAAAVNVNDNIPTSSGPEKPGSRILILSSTLMHIAEHCPKLLSLSLAWCSVVTDTLVVETGEYLSTQLHTPQEYLTRVKITAKMGLEKLLESCSEIVSLDLRGCDWVTDDVVLMIVEKGLAIRALNLLRCPRVRGSLAKLFFVEKASELKELVMAGMA
ncbi:hypothetical protein HDU76_003949 [Blyttiomyces sp. JEL0837]|nr:hypothetical protein HDU76_003949 [Blyttiomyces sp. JEL0837]